MAGEQGILEMTGGLPMDDDPTVAGGAVATTEITEPVSGGDWLSERQGSRLLEIEVPEDIPAREGFDSSTYRGVRCKTPLNHILEVNDYLSSINRRLMLGEVYVGNVETYYQLRQRIGPKYGKWLQPVFLFGHFIVKRVIPKWSLTQRLHLRITKGKNRVFSLTEVLGRLSFCGFDIIGYKVIDGYTCYSVRKIGTPKDNETPSYGALVRLRRCGEGGREIGLYKLRSMHPYAEYLQEFAYKQSELHNGDKIKDDFRTTTVGRFLRRYWLDELPMLFNLLRGDIKLVGVRPLSAHKLSLYAPVLRQIRSAAKPGLLPPFYADLPGSFEELQESEMRYLEAYREAPLRTDLKYFGKALINILLRGARGR